MKQPNILANAIERTILAVPRQSLRWNSRKKLRALLGAMETCIATRAKVSKLNLPDIERLFDASLFCLIYEADLTVLSRDMTCRSAWWDSRLYARLLAMTMLECVEDIPAVLGKSFRQALTNVVTDRVHLQQISKMTGALSDFRKNHEHELREIRQIAAAHRDHDSRLVASSIERLDLRKLTVLSQELGSSLMAFYPTMTEVLLELNILREILRSRSNK
ncbi:MAG: hypothetical protein HZA90_06485 [Verrucomicrobia bacterium]|nr:hypothetical protein [Verrucomicrobiota bacterium]